MTLISRRHLRTVARVASAVFAVGLTLVALVAVVAPVAAQSVPALKGLVTDETQEKALSARRGEIETALTQLQDQKGIQLFVLFVDSTGGEPIADYAGEVGRQNSLGTGDSLLVVALQDRTYWLAIDPSLDDTISPSVASAIRSDAIEPRLRAGDYPGAVIATAQRFREAADAPGPVTEPGPVGEPSPVPTGGVNLVPVLALGLLILGGLWVFGAVRTMRHGAKSEKRTAEERDQRTGNLAREANQQLIRTDDALRDADQELGFAEAEFGEAGVVPYRDAIGAAATEMKAAFALRQ